MSIDIRLKELRKSLQLTQQTMADRLGVKRQTIAAYEIGNIIPSEAVMLSICREFNVDRYWLETGEGNMFIERTLDEELAGLMGKLLSDEPESFRKRFLSVLLRFGDDEWGLLEKVIQEMNEMVSQTKNDTEP